MEKTIDYQLYKIIKTVIDEAKAGEIDDNENINSAVKMIKQYIKNV